jgi:hypothetical protein
VARGLLEESTSHFGYLLAVRQPHVPSVYAWQTRAQAQPSHTCCDMVTWEGVSGSGVRRGLKERSFKAPQTAGWRARSRLTFCPGGSVFPCRSRESMVAKTMLVTCSIPWSEFSIR